MLIVFSSIIGAGVVINASLENDKEEAGANSFAFSSIVSPIIATIDNGVAVHKAKKKVKQLSK
jgi:hypothetical protein